LAASAADPPGTSVSERFAGQSRFLRKSGFIDEITTEKDSEVSQKTDRIYSVRAVKTASPAATFSGTLRATRGLASPQPNVSMYHSGRIAG